MVWGPKVGSVRPKGRASLLRSRRGRIPRRCGLPAAQGPALRPEARPCDEDKDDEGNMRARDRPTSIDLPHAVPPPIGSDRLMSAAARRQQPPWDGARRPSGEDLRVDVGRVVECGRQPTVRRPWPGDGDDRDDPLGETGSCPATNADRVRSRGRSVEHRLSPRGGDDPTRWRALAGRSSRPRGTPSTNHGRDPITSAAKSMGAGPPVAPYGISTK
jgi:hypothetical protein